MLKALTNFLKKLLNRLLFSYPFWEFCTPMKIDPATTDPKEIYSTMIRAINPRPVAWVSTLSPNRVPNLAPFSYFSGVGSKPASLMFSVVNWPDGRKKDTLVNIEANKEFVVNIPSFGAAAFVQQTAEPLAYEVSEFEQFGLTEIPSERVVPPRCKEAMIHFECKLLQVVKVGEGALGANVVIGEIVLVHIDPAVLDDRGKIAPEKLDTIGRMGGREYCRTIERFVPSVTGR